MIWRDDYLLTTRPVNLSIWRYLLDTGHNSLIRSEDSEANMIDPVLWEDA